MPADNNDLGRLNLVALLTAAVFFLSGLASLAGLAETGPVRSDNVEAELLSEVESIQPGQPFWVGVRLDHAPHWHTYWINPGDSGLETTIDWALPEGFAAGPIKWPYPERLRLGHLVSFGFEREVLLMVEITPPADLSAGVTATMEARVSWLECKEECLPGEAEFALTLPVTAETPELNQERSHLFTAARAEWPMKNSGWNVDATPTETGYKLLVRPPDGLDHEVEEAEFFPLDSGLLAYGSEQNWRKLAGGYALNLTRDPAFDRSVESLRGVLVASTGWHGSDSGKALYVETEVRPASEIGIVSSSVVEPKPGLGLLAALGFAFIGGLALNLMPCVFPVISIKIMGFVRQAEDQKAQVLHHGLLFGLGIMASFWVLAGLLIALRAGGEQLGWGFQLQSPVFLIAMSVLFFLLALNLFGVFEVGVSWLGLGSKPSGSTGWTGAFFSGALATLIATPCTAPFMGAALGYALTLSPFEALVIFTSLGLGMASPYVLLSAFPQWLSRIPKPGAWMESFKQAVGWVFILVVLHMVHVLHVMGGGAAVILLLYVMSAVGVGAWILGRWGVATRRPPIRLVSRLIATLLIFGGLGLGLAAARHLAPSDATAAAEDGMPWQTFTPELLAELRAEGSPVFINFTAAWCLSCQVNERVAFASRRVQEAFRENNIIPLKADWTNRDDVIGRTLAGYGRSSVPFYVLYGPDSDRSEPQILPPILTPRIVLDAVEAM